MLMRTEEDDNMDRGRMVQKEFVMEGSAIEPYQGGNVLKIC
jgi:hypothetical protein